MVRLKDVAHLAGYDVSTVSKVLQGGKVQTSQEAKQRILQAADQLGYRPNLVARALRTRRSGAIVIAFPQFGNVVHPALIQGAEEAATRFGDALLVYKYPGTGATESLLNLVLQGRVDGILMTDDVPDESFLSAASERKVPIVTLNRQPCEVLPSVVLDDAAGFAVQANYLIELGHKHIVFIGVHPESQTSRFCNTAFLDACARARCPLSPERILACKFDGSDAATAVQAILAMRPRPTAIAAASLVTAMRTIQGLVEAGLRVPQDISVIGYHDSPIADWSSPPATTVRMPSVPQGTRGVERLHALIEGDTRINQEIVGTPIMVVERGSCGPAPK